MRRDFIVPLSIVLCTLVIVGSCPLHHPKKESSDDTQNFTTDEESILPFQSPQKEEGALNMGGYLSRTGRRTRPSRETKQEVKQEGNDESPRFEREGDTAEKNEIEVDQRKKKSAELKTSDEVADDHDEESCSSTKQCDDRVSKEIGPVIESRNLNKVEKEASPISPNRRVRAPSVTDDILGQELIIESDSDMAVDILSEVPGTFIDPPERVAVLITGEPVIYHPRPLPADEEIIVEVDVEDDVEDDFDMKRKRELEHSDENPEEKQRESLEPRETIVNVGVKEWRKRSADETSKDDSASENVVKVRVGMYHPKNRSESKKLKYSTISSTSVI